MVEQWNVGDKAWFEYHCLENSESHDAPIWYRSHQRVMIIGQPIGEDFAFTMTAAERADDGVPLTYRIRFLDGLEWDAWEDELLASCDDFIRPSPPSLANTGTQ